MQWWQQLLKPEGIGFKCRAMYQQIYVEEKKHRYDRLPVSHVPDNRAYGHIWRIVFVFVIW